MRTNSIWENVVLVSQCYCGNIIDFTTYKHFFFRQKYFEHSNLTEPNIQSNKNPSKIALEICLAACRNAFAPNKTDKQTFLRRIETQQTCSNAERPEHIRPANGNLAFHVINSTRYRQSSWAPFDGHAANRKR